MRPDLRETGCRFRVSGDFPDAAPIGNGHEVTTPLRRASLDESGFQFPVEFPHD